jgi:hypothetical protein
LFRTCGCTPHAAPMPPVHVAGSSRVPPPRKPEWVATRLMIRPSGHARSRSRPGSTSKSRPKLSKHRRISRSRPAHAAAFHTGPASRCFASVFNTLGCRNAPSINAWVAVSVARVQHLYTVHVSRPRRARFPALARPASPFEARLESNQADPITLDSPRHLRSRSRSAARREAGRNLSKRRRKQLRPPCCRPPTAHAAAFTTGPASRYLCRRLLCTLVHERANHQGRGVVETVASTALVRTWFTWYIHGSQCRTRERRPPRFQPWLVPHFS